MASFQFMNQKAPFIEKLVQKLKTTHNLDSKLFEKVSNDISQNNSIKIPNNANLVNNLEVDNIKPPEIKKSFNILESLWNNKGKIISLLVILFFIYTIYKFKKSFSSKLDSIKNIKNIIDVDDNDFTRKIDISESNKSSSKQENKKNTEIIENFDDE